MRPVCLTIAGVDSSGGAGVSIDQSVIRAAGVHPACVVTATTAQNSRGVFDIHPVPPNHLRGQLDAVLTDMNVKAVKTGMLPDTGTIRIVGETIATHSIPLVVDPVMAATTGTSLTLEEVTDAVETFLYPVASLLTPNLPEARHLLKREDEHTGDALRLARELMRRSGVPVLVKGGHGGDGIIIDALVTEETRVTFRAQKRRGTFHGTGCALSAGIAAHLALGLDLEEAVRAARTLLLVSLDRAFHAGKGDLLYLVP